MTHAVLMTHSRGGIMAFGVGCMAWLAVKYGGKVALGSARWARRPFRSPWAGRGTWKSPAAPASSVFSYGPTASRS
ncbi:MAG: hypothetical protein QM757_10045 [Paludibaculum sp.]